MGIIEKKYRKKIKIILGFIAFFLVFNIRGFYILYNMKINSNLYEYQIYALILIVTVIILLIWYSIKILKTIL